MVVKTVASTATSCLQTHLGTTASGVRSARGGHMTNVLESTSETTISDVNCVEAIDIIGSVLES